MFRLLRLILILAILTAFGVGAYKFVTTMGTVRLERNSTWAAEPVVLTIPENLSRLEMARIVGSALGWSEKESQSFAVVYAQIQWAAFNKEFLNIFSREFDWGDERKEAFEINSTSYFKSNLDFSGELYVPGVYTFNPKQSHAEISNILVLKIKEIAGEGAELENFISEKIKSENRKKVVDFIERQLELLPDLVPLPAKDVTLDRAGERALLKFSTIYYNQGDGPLELRADPETYSIREDVESDVFQRVYRSDGTYREKFSGNFLWHQEHLHYHFNDFVTYDLEAVSAKDVPDLSGVLVKSTFCVRDVSLIDMEVENRPEDANYKICGKRIQGISVGWADTYFFTYPDQSLDVSNLPSGTYRLSFHVNPSNFLDELSFENNKSSVLIELDMEKFTATVLEENPKDSPSVTHVYEEQVF
jgi:hypothetical protein